MAKKERIAKTPGTPMYSRQQLSELLRAEGESYFTRPANGRPSKFEKDLAELTPEDRVATEIKILEYHMPKMRSTDLSVSATINMRVEDRLRALCGDGIPWVSEAED